MAKELPKRSEVKLENTWKLEDMYATLEEWGADVVKIRNLVEELETMKGSLRKSAGNLYRALNLSVEIDKTINLAANYAHRASDVDTKNNENQAKVQRIMAITVESMSRLAFLEPEALGVSRDQLEEFIKEAGAR